RYRVVGIFNIYIGGALRDFAISTNDMYTVSLIPKGVDFISNLLPNPTAGMTSFTVEIPKSWHDPAGGQDNRTVPASVESPALDEIQTPVEIHVYNIKGQRIHTIFSNSIYGETRTFTWHGLDRWGKPVAPGIYFIRVQAGGHTDTKKVVIIR
ncbi:MAG: T9SS type A sorting domain-containing protein, partial [Candidatus Krumholzibacteria bacterium]|nr:T9SS type A sorting domain-containing protein [Candidatus Krumholzibacteria bacterium]